MWKILPISVFDLLTNCDFVKTFFDEFAGLQGILKIESQTLVSSSIFVLLKFKKLEMIFLMLIRGLNHVKLVEIKFLTDYYFLVSLL